MKLFLHINLLLFLFTCECLNAQNSLVPLHINDVITKINTHRYFQFDEDFIKLKKLMSAFKRQEYKFSFNQISSNISTECLSQINNLINALEDGQNWALRSSLFFYLLMQSKNLIN